MSGPRVAALRRALSGRSVARAIPEKLRWRIASLLNRGKWSCWAELVGWAIDPVTETSTLRKALRGARWCAQPENVEQTRACYCGKVRYPELDQGCSGRPTRPLTRSPRRGP